MHPRDHALQQEKPQQQEVPALQLERNPYSPELEKNDTATNTLHSQKEINK